MPNRVVHFEIQAEDPERAMRFYKDIFGWNFEQWGTEKYWMVMTDSAGSPQAAGKEGKEPGINGGLLPRKGGVPVEGAAVNAYVCTVQVDAIDEIIRKIEAGGGTVALPKFAFPGMAWQAYYKDPEGNIFGIHQPDPNAK